MLPRLSGWESIAGVVLCLLLLWAPLPAGSVRPVDQLVFRLVAFGLFAFVAAGRAQSWSRSRVLPVAALAAVALLGAVQSCRWPAGVADVVSPEHVRLYRQAASLPGDPALSATARDPVSPAVHLSLDAAASRSAALSWLAAAALLAAAMAAGRSLRCRRWILAALVLAATLQIGLGLLSLHGSVAGGLQAALLRPEGRLRGTFANPNHLSLLFEITMAAVVAWGLVALSGFRRLPLRRRLVALMPPVLWLLLLGAVVLTGSRAGLVAALLGMVVQVVALPFMGHYRKAGVAVALIVLVGLGGLTGLGSGLEIRRYSTVSMFESNLRSRMLLVPAALQLWRRFPVTGTGLGTFEDAFPSVATPELEPVLWNRAHNDPLELLVTGGVIGFGLGLIAAAALLSRIWRRLRHAASLEDRAAGLAALGVLAVAGVHEMVDFGLVIPANTLALLAVVGAAAAAEAVRGTVTPGIAPTRD